MKRRSAVRVALTAVLAAAGLLITSQAGAAAGGSGPYPADYQSPTPFANHTVYRPLTLPSEKLPVFAWGNGGCGADGTAQGPFLREIASHGFLVIASGAPGGSGSTTSQLMSQSIDWAISENSRQGSPLYGKVDTSKIAVGGWSCGGLEAYAVSNDSRITTTTIFSSGLLNDGDDYQLRRLTKPIAYFIGGPSDIAYGNAMDDWGKLPLGLPAFMGNLNVGHGGTYTQTNGGEFGRVAVLYLKWRLKGDITAGSNFVGSNCGLCRSGQWQVQQKNLTLDTSTPPPPTTSTPPTSQPPTSEPPTSVPPTTTTPPPGGCTATFDPAINSWPGGFVANVKITSSSTINSWTVGVNLPSGATITGSWNGTFSGRSGSVSVTPSASWNAQVTPSSPKAFGFQGSGSPSGMTLTCTPS
jgi:Cellulose binding domain